jgi:FMN phosphatase YigB (HAD superfamily)
MKRYVFDLDNTLCDTKKKENGDWDYLGADPFQDRIDFVNNLYEEGHYIIIETARGCVSKKNWYEKTFNQLINFGLKFHELRTGVKFNADFFVDDKAINPNDFFNGSN